MEIRILIRQVADLQPLQRLTNRVWRLQQDWYDDKRSPFVRNPVGEGQFGQGVGRKQQRNEQSGNLHGEFARQEH